MKRSTPPRWKRVFDLCITVPLLVVISPALVALALLVRFKLASPVLFRQARPGLNGEIFVLLKFRTMTEERDAAGNLLPDTQRLTQLGRFLRSTSLDELPELLNVLKGEMSLVGPRPLLSRYLPHYSPREQKRFEVLPGITGWAQVNGRNQMAWDARLAADAWYVENLSLWLDVKILCLTFLKVIRRDNVQVDPHAFMLDLDEERKRIESPNHLPSDQTA